MRRVALITGAGRRIGAVIAEALHQKFYDVIVHYHQSEQEALALVARLNSVRADSAIGLRAFLKNRQDCENLMRDALAWHKHLDVLVNNASVFFRTPIQEKESTAVSECLWTTNVQVPFWLSEAAYPQLAHQQGVIINMTDTHADKPLRDYTVYCQTKAALKMQTESLAKEYAPQVRVNAVAPGAIAWPEGANVLNSAQKDEIIAKTLLKRHGEPQSVAMAVCALAENPFITGQTLRVDGGRNL